MKESKKKKKKSNEESISDTLYGYIFSLHILSLRENKKIGKISQLL